MQKLFISSFCAFLFWLAIVPNISNAVPPIAYQCNGCTSTQIFSIAEAHCGSLGNPLSSVYVYDLTAGKLYFQLIHWNYDSRGNVHGPCTTSSLNDVTANGSIVSNAFVGMKNAADENGGPVFLVHFRYDSPGFPAPDRNATVYDVIDFSAIQNDISDALLDAKFISSNIDAFLQWATNLVLDNTAMVFQIEFTLVDGAKVTFQWTTGTHEIKLTKAVDSNNNTMPLTPANVPGRYRFGNGTGGPFIDWLHGRYGVDLPGGVPTCVNSQLACTSGGGATHCEIVQCF